MTIRVDPAALAATVAEFGSAYLLTVSDAGDIKVNTVDPVVTDAITVPSTSMQARLNIAGQPKVTLVWPPTVRHGHTLIVDGTATASEDAITVAPGHAILHRPADHADGPAWADNASCVQDCRSA